MTTPYKQGYIVTLKSGRVVLAVIEGLDRADGETKAKAAALATETGGEFWAIAAYPTTPELPLKVTTLTAEGRRADGKIPPKKFDYSKWRHGGWYVHNVRHPAGGCGCVSNNYDDKKWRIVCDPRPFENRPTFKTRDEAAMAEWLLANGE